MRINKIVNKIQNKIDIYKYEQQQKRLNHFVNIKDNGIQQPAMKEIYQAKKLLANYAMSKGVTIDIFDSHINKKTPDSLLVRVTNLLSLKKAEAEISADTTAIFPKVKENPRMLHCIEKGCEYQFIGQNYVEDTFLRNLYRNIEVLTYSVTKQK